MTMTNNELKKALTHVFIAEQDGLKAGHKAAMELLRREGVSDSWIYLALGMLCNGIASELTADKTHSDK